MDMDLAGRGGVEWVSKFYPVKGSSAGCAVAHPENPVGVQNTYFAHPASMCPLTTANFIERQLRVHLF